MQAAKRYKVPPEKRAQYVDKQSQEILAGLSFPADYMYICQYYDAHLQNASITMIALNIGNTRMYSALRWRKDSESFQRGKGGAPNIIKQHHIMYIETITLLCPRKSNKDLATMLVQNFVDIDHCSEKTVGRYRKALGFNYKAPLFAPAMTPVAKTKRVAWCQKHLQNGTDFGKVVFSDESWFELGPDNRWLWRKNGDYREEVCAVHAKFPKKVMVWGAVGKDFKSELIFWEGNVNKENYYQTLHDHNVFKDANQHFGEGQWIFQQDNAPPHVAKATLEKFRKAGIPILKDWPPYSPDLNIIEGIWGVMKHQIDSQPKETLEQLIVTIKCVWQKLPLEAINEMIDSMNLRLQMVIAKNGDTIFLNEIHQQSK